MDSAELFDSYQNNHFNEYIPLYHYRKGALNQPKKKDLSSHKNRAERRRS